LACHEGELSVLLTTDDEISRLNRQYLNREGPTNVLAFPMSGGPWPQVEVGMLGDVVISVDTAAREAEAADEPIERAVDRLLIHGILHLRGYDHETSSEEARRMAAAETRLMEMIEEE
jgi:rRNA maturation RNase YbeY